MPSLPKDQLSSDARELNGRDWAAHVTYEVHGLRLSVRADDSRTLESILHRMPAGSAPAVGDGADCVLSVLTAGNGGRQNELYLNDRRLAQSSDFDDLCDRFESDVGLYVAENARDRVFVHAGCVSLGGRAILIPGRSCSGKTTLVAAFLRAGATYYSDEYGVLDDNGLVHAYARPLSLRSSTSAPRVRAPAETLGAPVGHSAIPVRLVLATAYQEGGHWRPRRLTPGESVFALLDNTVCARKKPAESLAALRKVAESAESFSGVRGEADAFVREVFASLA